ncbi:MAG: phosphate-selective porin [Bacteroidota bacterium]|nr:phosphate-selective porin [Bacteroidota bacterium]
MKKPFRLLTVIVLITLHSYAQNSQSVSQDSILKELLELKKEVNHLKEKRVSDFPRFQYKSGLGFTTPDSSYSVNIRFRMQNRFLMNTKDEEHLEPGSWEARVRRCRLSFAGHVVNQKWNYYLQLSFSRGDMDWSDADASIQNTSPNVVRDAMIFYRPVRNLQFGFGQGKLPGNRQRVISSGAQQFYDRSRETKPKVSIAGGYHLNDLAVRTGGQLGKDLMATRSYNVYMADFVFKYQGFALSSEYIRRDTDGSPVVIGTDAKLRTIVTGDGINTQLSYCFKNRLEIAARHSLVSPHNDLLAQVRENEQYGLGVSKYLYHHKVKIQGNVFYNRERNLYKQEDHNKYFFGVLQIELGI